MGTMNMKPQNILILAAVGIGAYWFLSRRSYAGQALPRGVNGALLPAGAGATRYSYPAAQPDPTAPLLNALGQRLGAWLGTAPAAPMISTPDYSASNPVYDQWATDQTGAGLF